MSDEDTTFREYRNEIESIADNVENHVSEYDMDPSQAIHEEVDSHQWIIYYSHNLDVLRHSGGPDEWQHLVGDTNDWQEVVQAMSYDAMRTDVWEELGERDMDF